MRYRNLAMLGGLQLLFFFLNHLYFNLDACSTESASDCAQALSFFRMDIGCRVVEPTKTGRTRNETSSIISAHAGGCAPLAALTQRLARRAF